MRETVSLRNLPATILDLAGHEGRFAVPGPTAGGPLASRFSTRFQSPRDMVISELPKPNPYKSESWSFARSGEVRWSPWPKTGLSTSATTETGKRSFTTSGKTRASERDLSRVEAMKPVLDRLRRQLDQTIRFNP